jgi:glycosyltransferase involved in cell wall biosynthesis
MAKHIAFFVSSLNLGGVERAFVTLANSFVEDGHKVDFIVSLNDGVLKSELDTRINIVDLKCSKLRNTFIKLYSYISKSSADILITGPTYPNIIAVICNLVAFKKLKVVVTQHSYQDVEMDNLGLVGKLAPYFIKRTYNYADKVVAVSHGVQNDLISTYNIDPSKIKVIYNAVINDSFFKKSNESVDELILKKDLPKDYLVAVGRLEIVKNYPFLLNVYAKMRSQIPDFKYDLIILGDGSERNNLETLTKELGIQKDVHFLGALSNPFPIIKNARVLIHTSFSEAMPLVYVEALALQVPVVTTINKGAVEVLNGVDQKIIVESYDEKEFISAVLIMLENNKFLDLPSLDKFHSDFIKESFLALI